MSHNSSILCIHGIITFEKSIHMVIYFLMYFGIVKVILFNCENTYES